MKRTQLRSKEFSQELHNSGFDLEISKKDQVESVEIEEKKIILSNQQPAFFYLQDRLLPTLKFLQTHSLLKKVTIDAGAIKFIINGADVMRPGITSLDEGIIKDQPIVIIDSVHGKELAVGLALFSSEEIRSMSAGKVIRNIHYVGDEFWKLVF